MANKSVKRKKSKYSNAIRIANKIKKLTKHTKKHKNDNAAIKALNLLVK